MLKNFIFKSKSNSDLLKILQSIQTEQRYQRVDLARCLAAIKKLGERPEPTAEELGYDGLTGD